MTQPSSVRFVMEDRFNDDLDAFRAEINSDQDAFETQVTNQITSLYGQNYVMNGAFDVWQRGITFGNSNQYVADRWRMSRAVAVTARTATREPLNNAIPELENVEYYLRSTLTTVGTGSGARVINYIEDVNKLAGKTVTLSWYGKHSSPGSFQVAVEQNFGDGGSTSVSPLDTTVSYTTAWERKSLTFTMSSILGKTVGPNNYIAIYFYQADANGSVLDITGLKLEEGNTATAFSRQNPSIQGELAACQRYYQRINANTATSILGVGASSGTTTILIHIPFKTTMRIPPSAIDFPTPVASNFGAYNYSISAGSAVSALSISNVNTENIHISCTVTGAVANTPAVLRTSLTSAYIGFSAELI